jgi:hypothetical protein
LYAHSLLLCIEGNWNIICLESGEIVGEWLSLR